MVKLLMVVAVCVLFFSTAGYAFGPPPDKGFSFSLGPGGGYAPEYMGSDSNKSEILPYVELAYTHDWIRPFVSVADGAGLKVFSSGTGLFASGGIDWGESRKRGDDCRLEGTGTIDNLFKYFVKTGIETEPFDFIICVNYFRVETEYAHKERNKKYNAFLFSPRLITGYPVLENLIFQLETGLSVMNSSFAEAYHSVRFDTDYHKEYRASAGLHDAYTEMTIVFMPVDVVSVIVQGRYTRLLGDAGRSPLTDQKNMFEGKLFAAYSFFP